MGDVPTHWGYAGWVSTLGNPTTYRAASATADICNLVVTTSDSGDGGSGLGGGGDLFHPPPENSCTVCCDRTHYVYVPGFRAAPRRTGLPMVVGIVIYGPGEDMGGVKGGVDGRQGGGGEQRRERLSLGINIVT